MHQQECETNLRKKWKRSLTSRKAFLPKKNAWRARDMSWFDEYLQVYGSMGAPPTNRYITLTPIVL